MKKHINFSKKKIFISLLLLSIVFTMSSLFWTTDVVYNRYDLGHAEFGWPFSFVIQDQNRLDPPFAYETSIAKEMTSDFLWFPFFASMTVNLLLIISVWQLVYFFITDDFNKHKTEKFSILLKEKNGARTRQLAEKNEKKIFLFLPTIPYFCDRKYV